MQKTTRRHFLKTSLAAGSSVMIHGCLTPSARAAEANERLRIAVAGVNGRGQNHIDGWLEQDNVEIAYLIDPDQRVLAAALEGLSRKLGGKSACRGVTDVREALEDKSLDALSIATPNHWHSLMTIWGAQAGKHVYVEKPMSHDVAEGRVAFEAQKKYGVVVQHGTQSRSDARNAGLHDLIRAGKFGRLKVSYGYCCKPRAGIGFKSPSAPPADLDWNLWRGPAIIDQFHENYVHYNWHWFWETGNGDLNNQGTHQLDMARWALDEGLTHPIRAMAIGGRFQWNDQGETPNTMFGIGEYPNGQFVFFNVRNVNYQDYPRQVENEYYFEDGGKIIRDKYYPKGSDQGEVFDIPHGKATPGGNWGSFVAACRAGKPELANGTAAEAHYGCVLGHLINNSYRLGRPVPFQAKAGRFGDNQAAYEHFMGLHTIMSEGVGVPEEGNHYIVGPWLTFDPKTECHTGEFAAEANELLKDANRPGFKFRPRTKSDAGVHDRSSVPRTYFASEAQSGELWSRHAGSWDVRISLVMHGDEAFAAAREAIENARASIRFESYIYALGSPGEDYRDLLAAASQRGVQVRVLVDAFGSLLLPERFWNSLREAGGEVRWFNRMSLDRFNIRNHRKLIVCDDAIAMVGGFNVAAVSLGDGVQTGWCDLALRLTGPLGTGVGGVFRDQRPPSRISGIGV